MVRTPRQHLTKEPQHIPSTDFPRTCSQTSVQKESGIRLNAKPQNVCPTTVRKSIFNLCNPSEQQTIEQREYFSGSRIIQPSSKSSFCINYSDENHANYHLSNSSRLRMHNFQNAFIHVLQSATPRLLHCKALTIRLALLSIPFHDCG